MLHPLLIKHDNEIWRTYRYIWYFSHHKDMQWLYSTNTYISTYTLLGFDINIRFISLLSYSNTFLYSKPHFIFKETKTSTYTEKKHVILLWNYIPVVFVCLVRKVSKQSRLIWYYATHYFLCSHTRYNKSLTLFMLLCHIFLWFLMQKLI